MKRLPAREDGLVIPATAILGRKNCTKCGAWRYLHEFNTHKKHGRVYIKSVCAVCERTRRKKWYQDKTPNGKKEYNREHYIKYVQPRLAIPEGDRRVDAWPLRRWLIKQARSGKSVNEIAFELDVDHRHIRELLLGYHETNCGLQPIKTIPAKVMAFYASRIANPPEDGE